MTFFIIVLSAVMFFSSSGVTNLIASEPGTEQALCGKYGRDRFIAAAFIAQNGGLVVREHHLKRAIEMADMLEKNNLAFWKSCKENQK